MRADDTGIDQRWEEKKEAALKVEDDFDSIDDPNRSKNLDLSTMKLGGVTQSRYRPAIGNLLGSEFESGQVTLRKQANDMHVEEKNIPVSAEYEDTDSRVSSQEQGNRIRGHTAPH